MAARSASRHGGARVPAAPTAYRVANFCICSIASWVILLGIASIPQANTRMVVAAAVAAASSLVGLFFDRLVVGACQRAAINAAEHITSEVRRRRL